MPDIEPYIFQLGIDKKYTARSGYGIYKYINNIKMSHTRLTSNMYDQTLQHLKKLYINLLVVATCLRNQKFIVHSVKLIRMLHPVLQFVKIINSQVHDYGENRR